MLLFEGSFYCTGSSELVLGCSIDVDRQMMTFSLNGTVLNDVVFLRRFHGFKDFISEEHAFLPSITLPAGVTAKFSFDPENMQYAPNVLRLPKSIESSEVDYIHQECSYFNKGDSLWLRSDWGDGSGISCVSERGTMQVEQCPSPARMTSKIEWSREDTATSDVLADFVQKFCDVTGNHFQDYIVYSDPVNPQQIGFSAAYRRYCESRQQHGLKTGSSASLTSIPSPEQLATAAAVVLTTAQGSSHTKDKPLIPHKFVVECTIERDVFNEEYISKHPYLRLRKTQSQKTATEQHYQNLVVGEDNQLHVLAENDVDLPSLQQLDTHLNSRQLDKTAAQLVQDRSCNSVLAMDPPEHAHYRRCDTGFINSIRLGVAKYLLTPHHCDWEIEDVTVTNISSWDGRAAIVGRYEGDENLVLPEKGNEGQRSEFYEHLGGNYNPCKLVVVCNVDIRVAAVETVKTTFKSSKQLSLPTTFDM
eukprot:SAG31_NODE_25_length_33055_cov_11.407919_22_plen_474_part_01